MKKKILVLFFTGHLLLIFFQALWANIDSYSNFHFDKSLRIPLLSLFKQNKYTEPYYILSGINTGYGFYGTHTSTEKYLKIAYLDANDKEIKSDRYFRLSRTNAIKRLEGYASFLTNYVADTEKLIEEDTTAASDTSPDVIRLRKRYQFRKDYVVKTLKWLGKREAETISGCTSYNIKLITIVPEDVWERKRKTKPKIYVVQEGTFPVQ
ncbi:MAG: hypothetical protein AAFX55_20650 [Bacteroidota bacterium]